MLNAIWLETFTTLCETGHFTRTAERLNMTQPGVSQHLRKLEEQVGHPLVSQQGKSFLPTSAGEAVFALGLSRRAEEERLRETIAVDDRNVGKLRIACSGSFAMLLYPGLLQWMREAPELVLSLEAAPRTAVLSGLLEGRFDLGVFSADPDHSRLEARRIGREELCLLLPADASANPVSLADLEARGLVSHPDCKAYADDLLKLNFPDTYPGADRLRIRASVNQIGQIPTPVAQGIGYTFLPRSGVEAYGRKDLLRVAALPKRRWHDLWLASRRGVPETARMSHATELILSAAKGLG